MKCFNPVAGNHLFERLKIHGNAETSQQRFNPVAGNHLFESDHSVGWRRTISFNPVAGNHLFERPRARP